MEIRGLAFGLVLVVGHQRFVGLHNRVAVSQEGHQAIALNILGNGLQQVLDQLIAVHGGGGLFAETYPLIR